MNATRNRTCSVEDCGRSVAANGWCDLHYKRVRRNGHTELRVKQTLADYMAERTRVSGPSPERPGLGPCHVWTGTKFLTGYGAVGLRTHHKALAHGMAYTLARGEIPDGSVIDHLCRNRACVNPEHLEVVSNEENLRRGKGYRLRNGMDSACLHGHEYTPENTYINPNDPQDIRCRTCSRIRDRKRAS